MKLQTNIPIKLSQNKIDYDSKVFLIGSCFVENMGHKLKYYKFEQLINPTGILFHPSAIAEFIGRIKEQQFYIEEELVYNNERWHCLGAHSKMSDGNIEVVLTNLNFQLKRSFTFLQKATHIVITLGTSWAYRYKETGALVANCHKIPKRDFDKELTEVDDIHSYLLSIVKHIRDLNADAVVLFTISPVRHLKDGFVENQRSKAHLITAVHKIIASYDRVEYFPSYEIMIDELRDYRFYDRDLLHPSPLAIDYIWEKFTDAFLSEEATVLAQKVKNIQQGLAHRPFDENSESHREFRKKLDVKISELKKSIPHISF
ncbi:MAG: GSCFA domain-containing protein [Leeuwenhoekiella sp.]